MKRAQDKRLVDLRIHNLRDWTTDKHHVVDDAPFGGGQGMVMKAEPIFAAVEDLQTQTSNAQGSTPKARTEAVFFSVALSVPGCPRPRRYLAPCPAEPGLSSTRG